MNDPSTTATNGEDTTSDLERRRSRLQVAIAAAEAATATAGALDARLDANAERRSVHETDLQATRGRVATLQKAVEALSKRRGRLRSEQKQAGRAVATAQARAERAEAKYDTAVLAELLRREKANDLALHAEQGTRDLL